MFTAAVYQPDGAGGRGNEDLRAAHDVVARLWGGRHPFLGLPRKLIAQDTQGWNSQHPFLAQTVIETRPRIVVELGVWKGASTIALAEELRRSSVNGVVVAVDTWLGSWDHWTMPGLSEELCFSFGYPQLYQKFASNILHAGLEDYVVPLPLDSANATYVLKHLAIQPDVVHIDGPHDYSSVLADLNRWWGLLAPGGTLIADDYDADQKVWPEVEQAVRDFRRTVSHEAFEAVPYKCRMRKV